MTETAEAGYPQGNPQEEKEVANTSRLALVLSFIKFMVGTVATGVATLIVSTQYHNAQLALEEKKSTAELVLAEKKADAAIKLEEKKNEHTMSLQDRVAEVEYLGRFLTQAMDDDTAESDDLDFEQSEDMLPSRVLQTGPGTIL